MGIGFTEARRIDAGDVNERTEPANGTTWKPNRSFFAVGKPRCLTVQPNAMLFRYEKQAAKEKTRLVAEPILRYMTKEQRQELIEQLRSEMKQAAKDIEFGRAAQLRDEIGRLEGK